MKKLITSMMAAVMTVLALSTASFANEGNYDTIEIHNKSAYNVHIKYRQTRNSWGVWEFEETLLAGQTYVNDAENIEWIQYRAHVPGYGWNSKIYLHDSRPYGTRDTVHHQVDAHGTATIFNKPAIYHSVTPHK